MPAPRGMRTGQMQAVETVSLVESDHTVPDEQAVAHVRHLFGCWGKARTGHGA